MKTASDFLWRLVHSLSSKEKLFFKRNFTAAHPPIKRLYLQLFDAVASQKKYDQPAIIKKFSPLLTKKNIAFQKHYLQRQICDALLLYESRRQAGTDIYRQIQLIRLYRKKGLPEEAHAIWKKAVIGARNSESFALLNLLKSEFEKLILFGSPQVKYDELHSIFKNKLITYGEYAGMISLRDIYTEILLLKRKAHYDMDDLLKQKIILLEQQLNGFTPPEQIRSFWYCHYYRMSKATLLYLTGDIASSLLQLQQVFDDWKKNSRHFATHGEYYVELLYMINYAGILHGSYEYVTKVFNDPINERITELLQRANFEAIKYLALNKIYNKTARYNEVRRLIGFMKDRYLHWEPLLNADLNRTACLSMGIGFFVLEQYDDALYFVKKGITWFRNGARDEHAAIAHILLLLITYSMNNSRLFDSEYRSTYAYFYKRKKKHPFETALVQCLHRTFYMKGMKARAEEYNKALEIFEQNREDVVQQMAFSIFNYPGWLMSRVQRISYRQFMEQNVKARKRDLITA